MFSRYSRRSMLAATAGLALSITFAGHALAADPVTISFLYDNNPATIAAAEKLVADFEAKNPDIKIETETRPGGGDGDNLVKTRLATGEMSDVFLYNSGSLFQQINPEKNLVDLSGEAWQANILDGFKKVVTAGGKQYGAPIQTAMGGGVLYNKKVFAKLGLSVPKTWAEFEANNAKLKAAGIAPVIQTFKDTWTSQLFVLGDFFNVAATNPTFAADYTANKAKYASTPAAMKGFQRQEEVFKNGYLNADFAAATYNDGLTELTAGTGAQYPMLSFAVAAIAKDHPDQLNDIGFFALPGDDAAKNGLTTWMPPGVYIPKSTKHEAEAKKFVAYIASKEGCDSQTAGAGATGPYLVKGCTLPKDVPPAVADLLPYFQSDATNAPALEFLSPVKGPSLEQITVEVGSGIRSAADGAALYDEDVKKQAQQLGLAGW
jgi:raffinose/stachyose/melibiose transport system substrate-binding protein